MTTAAYTLSGGWDFFLAFIGFMLLALIASSYTATGSGISRRPYGKVYGGAPGARRNPERIAGHTPGDRSPVDSRGTR